MVLKNTIYTFYIYRNQFKSILGVRVGVGVGPAIGVGVGGITHSF